MYVRTLYCGACTLIARKLNPIHSHSVYSARYIVCSTYVHTHLPMYVCTLLDIKIGAAV